MKNQYDKKGLLYTILIVFLVRCQPYRQLSSQGFCLQEAERVGLELPLTKKVDEQYADLQRDGLGRMDTSVLIKAVAKNQ